MKTLKTFCIIICVLIASSCVTQKRCNLKFPQVASHDSIYIQKLDTVKIVLPGDSVIIETKVPCDNFELITENGKLTSALKVVNGILSQRINIKPDTVTKFVTNTITKTEVVKVPEKIKFVPKFWKVTGWIGIASILIIAGYFGLKIAKKRIGFFS